MRGTISQMHESADPDPHQNVMDPEHCQLFSSSVADPDPGFGAFLPLDPGSGIGFFRIPDLESQTHIFESLYVVTTFQVKSSKILRNLAQIVFFSSSKIK
jgi:hypothetical protein